MLKAKLRLREAKLDVNLGAMPSVSPLDMHNLEKVGRGHAVGLYVQLHMTRSHVASISVNLQQLLWVGATRCPLLPRKRGLSRRALGAFARLSPHRLVSGKDRGSDGAGYVYDVNKTRTTYDTVEGEIQ